MFSIGIKSGLNSCHFKTETMFDISHCDVELEVWIENAPYDFYWNQITIKSVLNTWSFQKWYHVRHKPLWRWIGGLGLKRCHVEKFNILDLKFPKQEATNFQVSLDRFQSFDDHWWILGMSGHWKEQTTYQYKNHHHVVI